MHKIQKKEGTDKLKTLINQLLIFTYCLLIINTTSLFFIFSAKCVASFLLSVTIVTFCYFFSSKKITLTITFLYACASFLMPELIIFAPIITYFILRYKIYLPALLLFISSTFSLAAKDTIFWGLIILGSALSYYMSLCTTQYDILLMQSRKIRDDSTERNILLKEKNKSLLEKQNYEIYNATLQERNRIAREIHDNVGHMLSRAILLTGALKATIKDDGCMELTNHVQDALNEAMDNIRKSVHNLHDEAVNLEETVQSITNQFTFCKVVLNYDMSNQIAADIKYAFIAIIKEALNNIVKHSNATSVEITLREHPGIYQLVIHDNGTKINRTLYDHDTSEFIRKENEGIGLNNIFTRIQMLHGTVQISATDGFRIFITVPKK